MADKTVIKGVVTGPLPDNIADIVARLDAHEPGRRHTPKSLVTSAAHYRRRAAEGVSSTRQAEGLLRQLQAVAQAGGLVEHPERLQVVDVATYYLRNQDVADVADELLAFPVHASKHPGHRRQSPAEEHTVCNLCLSSNQVSGRRPS